MNEAATKVVGFSVLAFSATLPLSASAAELHVGSGQTHATVQAAVAEAAAGDIVVVHAGSYVEDVDITQSGSASSRIAMTSAGDGPATIEGRVTIDGSYWDITDLTFVARAGNDGFRLRGNYNHLISIDLSGGDRDGIDGGGVGNEVRQSTIHDFDGGESDAHCIVLNPGAEDWIIADNELYDCSGDTLQLYSDSATRNIKNLRVERNHMYFTGAISRTENAIDVKDADGLIIAGNVMHGFPENKVVVFQKGPANIAMRCNVMYDGFTGVEFRAEDGGILENVVFSHNLMHGYSSYALKFDGTLGAEVYNNTFVDIDNDGLRIEGAGLDGGTIRNNLWLNTGSVEAGNFDADHNGFFNADSAISSPSDVNADPLLDGDYRLTAGSPMIDAGTDVGLVFGGAAPDLGYDEMGADPCAGLEGEGGGGGSGPAAGSGGAGAGAGGDDTTGPGAGGAGPGAPDPAAEDGGGCACAVGRSASYGPSWAWLAAAAFALRRRARSQNRGD